MKHYYGYFLFMVCLLISSSSNSIAQEQSNMDEYLLTSSDSVLQQEDGFHKNNYVMGVSISLTLFLKLLSLLLTHGYFFICYRWNQY